MTHVTRLPDPQLTQVPGFRAAGVACGLKKDGSLDLAVILSDCPCTLAAVFTTNRVQAAPVLYDRALLRAGKSARAVVINSGNANACTGERGLSDVHQVSEWAGEALHVPADAVFIMSTGVIGQPLPVERIAAGLAEAKHALSTDGGHAAARAIMTTDTRPKEMAVRIDFGGKAVTIGGMCKGAGMIHPDMATMLVTIATDAAVTRDTLQTALKTVTDETFNMITVDGDMSTNDTVLLLANGTAGNPPIADTSSQGYHTFLHGLRAVATELSQAVVRDGEGATKFVTIEVTGAHDERMARLVAKSIAGSNLVKTAIYGQDANWGRVVCAAGYSGADLDPARISLWLASTQDCLHLVRDGEPFDTDESRAAAILADSEITYRLDLGLGEARATAWTCDLTHAYVDINAHYRT